MNSPKVVATLGLILILSLLWTACSGGGSPPPPPPGAPTITTTELPQGAVNIAYGSGGQGITLGASGGTGAYTWSIASGSLPPGLTLGASTGLLSGTPTTVGSYTFTAKVTDATGMSGTQPLTIYVEGVVIVSSTCGESKAANICPSGSANVLYTNPDGTSVQLTASGGQPPYKWSLAAGSNPLPAGLGLDPATCASSSGSCLITGTPTNNGAPTMFTLQVTDSETSPGVPAVGLANFTITIMSITTMSLPAGYANTPYNGTLTVAGGSPPYTWTASLPQGLKLDQGSCIASKQTNCTITGTPTQTGKFTATAMVTDGEKSSPAMAMASFPISVYQGSQLIINTTTLPAGPEGVPYNATLTASGGIQPYTWSISSGTLPTGLSLDPATCTNSSVPCKISGTPTTVGPFNFTVQVTDSGSPPQPATAQLSILITFVPVVITTTSLPSGLVGVPYSGSMTATGGVKPYTWGIASGNLPPGLGLDPTTCTNSSVPCMITGTPTGGGSFGFVVKVQDSGSPQQTVPANLGILINSLGNSTLNGNYIFNFSGYNNGTPVMMMVGSFVADGMGNITSGVLDYNDGTGESPDNNPTPQTIVKGAGSVYSIEPNGLGTMMITTNLEVFNLQVAIRSDGSGRLIQSDPTNKQAYGSGTIKVRNTNASPMQLSGVNFAVGVFGFDSATPPQRYAAAGVFQFQDDQGDFGGLCNGAGCLDVDDGGVASSQTFIGDMFNFYDSTTGRGVAGMTFKPNGDRHFFASYLVTANEMVIVSTEALSQPANLTLWSGLRQLPAPPTGFDNTMLSSTSVSELSALDTNGAVDVTAGLFVGQGVLGHSCTSGQGGTPQYDPATVNYDENQGGTSSLQQTATGTYCVDKTTARVMLTPFNNGPFATPPVFYMVAADQAFVVGTDSAVTSGAFDPQTGSPFTNASLFGLYAGGTVAPVTSTVTNSVSSLFADGGGNIQGTQYTSGPNGQPPPTQFTYTYGVDSTGRTLVCASGTCNAQSNNIVGVAYVVSPTKFVLLPTTDPNPALSVFGQ